MDVVGIVARVDPIVLELGIDEKASAGTHDVESRLTYYYCVKASGFCAPKRLAVNLPITVRPSP